MFHRKKLNITINQQIVYCYITQHLKFAIQLNLTRLSISLSTQNELQIAFIRQMIMQYSNNFKNSTVCSTNNY